MRLTAEVVHSAPQRLNCVGERELVLRNLAIGEIENVAVARDAFDAIDLSCNAIAQLGRGLPPLRRLRTLYVGNNRISSVHAGVADALPNLRTLILSANRIGTLQQLNLRELSRLRRLRVLCIRNNAVAALPDVRQHVLRAIPSLRVFNFTKVSAAERAAIARCHTRAGARKRSRHQLEQQQQRGGSCKRALALSDAEAAAVRARIEAARSVEEVMRIRDALHNGNVAHMLQCHNAAQAHHAT